MLNITAHKNSQKTVYQFQRTSDDQFRVGVDWEKSPGVRSGGIGVTFVEDRLELRGGQDQQWDIRVAPEGFEKSVLVSAPATGFRSPGATPPFSKVDLPSAVSPEDSRKVALQVASALVGIPFMETMLSMPVSEV